MFIVTEYAALMYLSLFVGVLCLSLFCYALLCVHSSFAIILKRKRKLVALLVLSYRCIVTINALWLFLTLPWVGLQCVIVVFPDRKYLPRRSEICCKIPEFATTDHFLNKMPCQTYKRDILLKTTKLHL